VGDHPGDGRGVGRGRHLHARPATERRQHPDARAVSAALRWPPPGGALLDARGVRGTPGDRACDGLRPRAGLATHPVVLSCLGAERPGQGREERLMATSTDHATTASAHSEHYAEWLRQMLLIRRFEERAGEAYAVGQIGGFCHLYIGQEAVAV